MNHNSSTNHPFFSVIIPAYNAGSFIEFTLQSVYKQSFTNFEIIVINDGSTDNTRDILDTQTDSRIKIVHQKNSGVSTTRNRGIQLAQGEYLAFLDADDIWLPNHLEIAHDFFSNYPEYVWYTARSIRKKHIKEEDCQISESLPINYSAINWFLEGHKILECGSNFFVKRTIIVENFDEFYPAELVMCEDNVAWCKLGILHPMMGVPNIPTVLYRIWGESAVHRHGTNDALLLQTIRKHQEIYISPGCPIEAQLFIKYFSYSNWWRRIRHKSMLPWRNEIKERAKVTGKFLTIWLLFFSITSELFCRLVGKIISVRIRLLDRLMHKKAIKNRKILIK